jgi:hypothetical protein
MKGWNLSPRLGCLCQLPLDRHGKLVREASSGLFRSATA